MLSFVSPTETVKLLPSPVAPLTKSNNEETQHTCKICNISFIFEKDLYNHLSISTSHKTQIFQCIQCALTFSSFRGMKQHYGKIHDKIRSMECEICSKTFKDKYALKFHDVHVHQNTQKVQCENCSFICYTKYVYRDHIKKCLSTLNN